MPPIVERIARALRLGRWKYFRGYDLEGNRYFELPHPLNPGAVKRTVDYRVKREWSEYGSHSMPIQWSTWLRQTRQDAPTMQELQKDAFRQAKLKEDVVELERAYQQERATLLAEQQRTNRIEPPRSDESSATNDGKAQAYPSSAQPAVVPTSSAETGHPYDQEAGASIPKTTDDGGLYTGYGQSTTERKQTVAALDVAADRNMGKASKEAQLREGVAKRASASDTHQTQKPDAPAIPTGNDYAPEAWKPVSRRR